MCALNTRDGASAGYQQAGIIIHTCLTEKPIDRASKVPGLRTTGVEGCQNI